MSDKYTLKKRTGKLGDALKLPGDENRVATFKGHKQGGREQKTDYERAWNNIKSAETYKRKYNPTDIAIIKAYKPETESQLAEKSRRFTHLFVGVPVGGLVGKGIAKVGARLAARATMTQAAKIKDAARLLRNATARARKAGKNAAKKARGGATAGDKNLAGINQAGKTAYTKAFNKVMRNHTERQNLLGVNKAIQTKARNRVIKGGVGVAAGALGLVALDHYAKDVPEKRPATARPAKNGPKKLKEPEDYISTQQKWATFLMGGKDKKRSDSVDKNFKEALKNKNSRESKFVNSLKKKKPHWSDERIIKRAIEVTRNLKGLEGFPEASFSPVGRFGIDEMLGRPEIRDHVEPSKAAVRRVPKAPVIKVERPPSPATRKVDARLTAPPSIPPLRQSSDAQRDRKDPAKKDRLPGSRKDRPPRVAKDKDEKPGWMPWTWRQVLGPEKLDPITGEEIGDKQKPGRRVYKTGLPDWMTAKGKHLVIDTSDEAMDTSYPGDEYKKGGRIKKSVKKVKARKGKSKVRKGKPKGVGVAQRGYGRAMPRRG